MLVADKMGRGEEDTIRWVVERNARKRSWEGRWAVERKTRGPGSYRVREHGAPLRPARGEKNSNERGHALGKEAWNAASAYQVHEHGAPLADLQQAVPAAVRVLRGSDVKYTVLNTLI